MSFVSLRSSAEAAYECLVSGKPRDGIELPFRVGFDKFSLSINEICE